MSTKQRIEGYHEQYGNRVAALCRSLCRNGDDAQDLYQETWMKALRHLDQYQSDQPFDKWIAAICVNTYKNTFRAFVRSRRMEFATNEEKDRFLHSLYAHRENRDTLIDLRQAVESLPTKYRILIRLKYDLDYTDREIADVTHLAEGTVKWRLHKARELLGRRMCDEA